MISLATTLRVAGALAFAAMGSGGHADGLSDPPSPVEQGRKFDWSFTVGATSDYVFRGISLRGEDPAFQPSVDVSYGIFYAGIWSSNLDAGQDALGRSIQPLEVDLYAGIKPELGPVTFDLGLIYYWFPGARDVVPDTLDGAELDFVEFNAGASVTPLPNLALTIIFYYAPSYYLETGQVWTIEGKTGYTLHALGIFTPTVNGVLGYSDPEEFGAILESEDSYYYWNAGLALEVQKLTFDFRYWDTDVVSDITDGRFVFSAKVVVP